jgi:hypothetical protein
VFSQNAQSRAEVIWVGAGPTRLDHAEKLIRQQAPIRVFTKDRKKEKLFRDEGSYQASNSYNFETNEFFDGYSEKFLKLINAGRVKRPDAIRCIFLSKVFEDEAFQTRVQKLSGLSDEELMKKLPKTGNKPQKRWAQSSEYDRCPAVAAFVLRRANGLCEGCREKAPFPRKSDETPYLEVHHKTFLSENGADDTENAIALCPNCHRREHFGKRRWAPCLQLDE